MPALQCTQKRRVGGCMCVYVSVYVWVWLWVWVWVWVWVGACVCVWVGGWVGLQSIPLHPIKNWAQTRASNQPKKK
jgi:hypothetical protein